MRDDALIRVEDLVVGYGKTSVLKAEELNLGRGQSTLVLGHNGAGKSTLLRTLFGLQPCLSGNGDVLGVSLPRLRPDRLVPRGGRFLGQGERSFAGLSGSDQLNALQRLWGVPPNDPGLASKRGRVGRMSVGQRRLAAISLIHSGQPDLVILDEPTAGLDPGARRVVLDELKALAQSGVSYLVVEHNFEALLSVFDHALVLRQGRVTFSGPAARLMDKALLRSVFM